MALVRGRRGEEERGSRQERGGRRGKGGGGEGVGRRSLKNLGMMVG